MTVRPRIARALAAATAIAVLGAVAAGAYVSVPERIHEAIAETNKADGRSEAIRLLLTMQVGERPAVATGELISHPTGLARLELRGAGGLLERHLLQGNELSAARNGLPLDDPRAFLPPFFILQADSGMLLRAALTSFAVQGDAIGLATCGDVDCLLIGDPRRAIPRPEPPPVRGVEEWEALRGDAESIDGEREGADGQPLRGGQFGEVGEVGEYIEFVEEGEPLDGTDGAWPRVWVEARTYEVRGFDDGAGARIRLGPVASFEKLRVPAWISIEEPGRVPARFDVTGASLVTAPAAAFSRDWLFSPDTDAEAPAGPAGAPTGSQ